MSEPDVRLAVINAVIRDVATRSDLESLRKELRGEIQDLRAEVSRNFRWTMGAIITVWGATVIPVLLRLVGLL